jgi:hypothetical protein
VCSGSVVRDCAWESWALGSTRTDLRSLALRGMQRIESHSGFDTTHYVSRILQPPSDTAILCCLRLRNWNTVRLVGCFTDFSLPRCKEPGALDRLTT